MLKHIFRCLSVLVVVSVMFSPVAPKTGPVSGNRSGVLSAEASTGGLVSEQSGFSIFMPTIMRGYPEKFLGVAVPLKADIPWDSDMDAFISQTGKAHGVYHVSSGFACPWVDTVPKIRPFLDHAHARGAIMLIAWLPFDCTGTVGNVAAVGLPDILNGNWDSYIMQWATDIGALGYPVMVRWGHEMNIPTYSWAGQHAFGSNGKTDYSNSAALAAQGCTLTNCYGDPNLADGPERYIAAYRHVHDLTAPRAPNIIWVWNASSRNWPLATDQAWNSYNNYYPGDAYVDWIGLDMYNFGPKSGNGFSWTWASFDYMFADALNDLAQRHPTKLQMIPEIASVEDPYGDPNRKANWICDAYRSAMYNYPLLRMVSWQNEVIWDGAYSPTGNPGNVTGGGADFTVNSSPQALAAYQQAIANWSSEAP